MNSRQEFRFLDISADWIIDWIKNCSYFRSLILHLSQAVDEYVEESGYVSKAPLYPVQYDMRIPSMLRF